MLSCALLVSTWLFNVLMISWVTKVPRGSLAPIVNLLSQFLRPCTSTSYSGVHPVLSHADVHSLKSWPKDSRFVHLATYATETRLTPNTGPTISALARLPALTGWPRP